MQRGWLIRSILTDQPTQFPYVARVPREAFGPTGRNLLPRWGNRYDVCAIVIVLFSFVTATHAEETLTPLQRLQRRSAENRWQQLTNEYGLPNTAVVSAEFQPPLVEQKPAELPRLGSRPLQVSQKKKPADYDALGDKEKKSEPKRQPAPERPEDMKKIGEIMPFADYEPDPAIRAEDPCRNLCPRPSWCPPPKDKDTVACPEEIELSNAAYEGRYFPETVFAWRASNLWHNPIYFEDVALERYGHTYPCCIQPFASAGKFYKQLIGLPYQMAIDHPCKKMYTLGHYRPGECAPKLHYQIPWNTEAAAVQAGVTTGLFFLIP